jgi:hypothetical protein
VTLLGAQPPGAAPFDAVAAARVVTDPADRDGAGDAAGG